MIVSQKGRIRAAFIFMGYMSYISYFAMMASVVYWTYFYNSQFTTIASFAYGICQVLGTYINLKLLQNRPQSVVVYTSIIVQTFAIVLMISCYYIQIFLLKYIITITMVVVLGFCGQFFNMACFNVGIKFDPLLPPLMIVGSTFNSLSVQILKDVMFFIEHKTLDDPNYETSLFVTQIIYFSIALAILLFGAVSWSSVPRMIPHCVNLLKCELKFQKQSDKSNTEIKIDIADAMLETDEKEKLRLTKKQLYKVLLPTNLGILFNFLGTGFIFPGLITQIPYLDYYRKYHSYVDPLNKLIVQTVWYFADCGTRFIINLLKTEHRMKLYKPAVVLSFIKLCFIPVFLILLLPKPIYDDSTEEFTQKPFLISIPFIYVITFLTGMTNGFCAILLFGCYGYLIDDQKDRSAASSIVAIFANAGGVLGQLCGVVFASIFSIK